jgi:hypothetical protein
VRSVSEQCRWLHEKIEPLPLVSYPFDVDTLPPSGIYFFYERKEVWGHGGSKPRIVRVGTARDGNFRSRIAEHYLLHESKMRFGENQPAPHDRSIFRKNLGRAVLNRAGDPYLSIWEVDMTSRRAREDFAGRRDIGKERSIEAEVTRLLQVDFSFRYIVLEGRERRMGSRGLESALIGTLARCRLCNPSPSWLGSYSPIPKIRERGLWLVQHLTSHEMTPEDQSRLGEAIITTQEFLRAARSVPVNRPERRAGPKGI